MTACMVACVEIRDPEAYREYERRAFEALTPFRIRPLFAANRIVTYEGELEANHFVVVEFESMEDIEKFYQSPLYREVIGLRHGAASTRFLAAMDMVET